MNNCGHMLSVRYHQQGFSYIEVLVAMVLLAITLIPALQGLEGALVGSKKHETITTQQYYLQSKFEDVLAQSFNDLDAAAIVAGSNTVPTSYSDLAGSNDRRLVFLAKYDGDNADADGDVFTGVDDNLIWVRVEIENTPYVLETLTNK